MTPTVVPSLRRRDGRLSRGDDSKKVQPTERLDYSRCRMAELSPEDLQFFDHKLEHTVVWRRLPHWT